MEHNKLKHIRLKHTRTKIQVLVKLKHIVFCFSASRFSSHNLWSFANSIAAKIRYVQSNLMSDR